MHQVRHPNILALKDTLEVEDKGVTTLYIITEPVTPLADILKDHSMEGPARCWRQPHSPAALAHAHACMRQCLCMRTHASRAALPHDLPRCVDRQEYIAMGLYHVARAVAFLNNDCGLVGDHLLSSATIPTVLADAVRSMPAAPAPCTPAVPASSGCAWLGHPGDCWCGAHVCVLQQCAVAQQGIVSAERRV